MDSPLANTNAGTVGRFFDALSADYTAVIERCFPRYREMLWALLDYLPAELEVRSILELGCGTGNLTVLLAEAFPDATIHYVDVAPESLDVCAARLGEGDRFVRECRDMRELDYESGSFDLVTSTIAIHHLTATEKRELLGRIPDWLRPGGVLAYADQCRGETDDLYRRHIDNWKRISLEAGSTEDEFAMWMEHQREHDHHETLRDQCNWLSSAGFHPVDCVWRYLLWSVIQARRV